MWAIGADVHMKTTTFFAFDDEAKPVTDFNRMFKSVRSNREGFLLVRMYLENIDYQILMENSSGLIVIGSIKVSVVTSTIQFHPRTSGPVMTSYMKVHTVNLVARSTLIP